MTVSVLDVLMYLVEHLDADAEAGSDRELVRRELVDAGFQEAQVSKALAWLDGLAESGPEPSPALGEPASTRVYTSDEARRMDVECRGYLFSLEQSGVIDPALRELIIDRVMALETETVHLDELRWVVLMVLVNQPGNELVSGWMEDLVFDGANERLH